VEIAKNHLKAKKYYVDLVTAIKNIYRISVIVMEEKK
jgi:hypothetical protein